MQHTLIQVCEISYFSFVGCSDGLLCTELPNHLRDDHRQHLHWEDPPELPLPSQPRSVSGSAGKQRAELLNDLVNTAPLDPSYGQRNNKSSSCVRWVPVQSRMEGPTTAGCRRSSSTYAKTPVLKNRVLDLMNALMAAQQQRPGSPSSTTAFSDTLSGLPTPPKPSIKSAKTSAADAHYIGLVSVCVLCRWREPTVHSENSTWQSEENSLWVRWARLSSQSSKPQEKTWQVQSVVCAYHVSV